MPGTQASTIYILSSFDVNRSNAITVPADVLAPNGARPSAGTVMTTELFMVPSNLPQLSIILNKVLLSRWHHSKWWRKFHKISRHLDGWYTEYAAITTHNIIYKRQDCVRIPLQYDPIDDAIGLRHWLTATEP